MNVRPRLSAALPVIVQCADLLVVFAGLALVSILPVFFQVPYNDEWLRMNYLQEHSVWDWTVMHAQTWVVRPTSEVILGIASLPHTRKALEHDFTPEAFLQRFHVIYVIIALVYWVMLFANAVIVARRVRAFSHFTLMLLALIICWLVSDELGYAFYWADGYANILMPFTLLTCGLPLFFWGSTGASITGAVLVLLGALGHEVVCIYTIGFAGLALVFRTPTGRPWVQRSILAVVLVACLGLALVQLFGEGAMIRNDFYFRAVGKRYDFENALLNIREISPLRAAVSALAAVLAIACYRDRLGDTPERMVSDFQRYRWFWILLALGTLATAFLPLGSVGLKKGRLAVSYYSVFTYLWFILLGVVLYPLFDRLLARGLAPYRRYAGSILPVLAIVCACSKNIGEFRDAVARYEPLKLEAHAYMQRLFGPEKRLRLCRPRHPYTKPGRTMTDRNQEEYFGLEKVYNRCPKS